MNGVVIIFSHYGYSSYLEYTLACAKMTNPNARLIFLGDENNISVAKKHGWEHYIYSEYESIYQNQFNSVFRHVQGRHHMHIKNGKDWLRYVFERWFFIEAFISRESIKRFWHFDSDTMILEDLNKHNHLLSSFDFTVQCNGTCLNGLMNACVVSEFCMHICRLFENKTYISAMQRFFDTEKPQYAFTEMTAFSDYKNNTERRWLHLLLYRDDEVFDDALCQAHGFDVALLPIEKSIKKIYSKDGSIYGMRDGQEIRFITLNLSWLPDEIYLWSFEALNSGIDNIENVQFSFMSRLVGKARKIRKLLRGLKGLPMLS